MRGRRSVATILLAAAMAGCRDEVRPFEPDDRPTPTTRSVRLTYSAGDDRYPAWSSDGDTVYYSAAGFEDAPESRGVLLKLPRAGGAARRALQNVQAPDASAEHWLVAPAARPDGAGLAMVEITDLWGPHPCSLRTTGLSCDPSLGEAAARLPLLREIAVRVRPLEATHALEADTSLVLAMPGVDEVFEGHKQVTVHDYPYHDLFEEERAVGFRATWAPDGRRLAISDGRRLLIWDTGDARATPVPNTEDGVWPAWSPDGEWVAFTRLERVDSTGAFCTYRDPFGVLQCSQTRTDYVAGPPVLSLIRPDGSDLTQLGEGAEPAWSPDGDSLYFRRGGRIWRSGADGSGASAIEGTENGREPAIAPDGRFLAYARLNETGDYDIWVTSLAR